jgi:hypothetical protein
MAGEYFAIERRVMVLISGLIAANLEWGSQHPKKGQKKALKA